MGGADFHQGFRSTVWVNHTDDNSKEKTKKASCDKALKHKEAMQAHEDQKARIEERNYWGP